MGTFICKLLAKIYLNDPNAECFVLVWIYNKINLNNFNQLQKQQIPRQLG